MRPAELLQEIRKMRFLEAHEGWHEGRLSQEEAARILGVCDRTFRRYVERYAEGGLDGLLDRRLMQVSHRRAPVDEVLSVVERYRHRHAVISAKGLPCSLYTDRGSHYWHTPEAGGAVDKKNLTQFGEAMKRLGIEMIPAYSPEARGRSERAFSTHQGRLPQELALAGITTLDAANRYLREQYRPAFNAEFAGEARVPGSAFVAWTGTGLDDYLCETAQRTVGNDNCVSFEGHTLQIPPDATRCHYVRTKVKVLRHLDGTLSILHGPRCLARYTPDGVLLGGSKLKSAA